MKGLKKMVTAFAATVAVTLLLAPTSALAATAKPAWSIQSIVLPTNFKPGEESGLNTYEVIVANSGGKTTDQSEITITDTLPAGINVKNVELVGSRFGNDLGPSACQAQVAGEVTTVTCKVDDALLPAREPTKLFPGNQLSLIIHLKVPLAVQGPLTNEVKVEGGGADTVTAESHNQASNEDAPAGFQEFHATLTGPDGNPVSGAASHPYQYTTSFAVNTEAAPSGSNAPVIPAEGDVKEIEVSLPPGLIGNPTSTERCTAQQFVTTHGGSTPEGASVFPNACPAGSAIGLAAIEQLEGTWRRFLQPVYNLVPPKGMPAQFGFLVGGPIYINTKLRSDGDYGVTAYLKNTTEAQRITAAKVTLWGNPADPSHDPVRAQCADLLQGNCLAEIEERPFFRLPSSCEGPLTTTMRFDTWLHKGTFLSEDSTEPAPVGCDLPPFEPSIEAKPTTNVADAPSGLHFNLHLPQAANDDPEGLAHADLRDAKVVLPGGFVVNPSSADGLEACSISQVGYQGTSEGRSSFSASPAACPDASKLGNVSVNTPLVDHPLPGAVYLATPHQNPFNSLLAIYIAIHDAQTGVAVKLAGEVSADPATGRLTTTVKQNPQTPFEDFTFDFFEGARAPLRTPSVCGTHTTTTELTPWSAPASPSEAPSDSFELTQSPSGGSCPASAGELPNAPRFEAGTLAPQAGSYSPLILRLSRQDGSQELQGLKLTLPPGLTGKLAGLSYCPEAALAGAASKSGKAEQAAPSCPQSSKLGTVTVGAGAGPAPYYAKGTAYLTAPYKGAPIGMAVITPAVAGPFDLGTVVVRQALRVDPETALIEAESDPLPTVLQGIPLDVRSIALDADRSQFTLNPTSCNPFAFQGLSTSSLGQGAALSQRFQVGGCPALSFKPKLSLRLKGGTKRGDHPVFSATLKMPPGGANIAKAQVALPHSEFLDQAHIRTICTRVQFAANACPKGAIYGFAKAWTPLLDQPLSGPVYLRSSSHELPDLVADLNGQIHVVLHGRTDSVNGGLRNTFEGVPDAPASKFVLTLKGGRKGLLVNSTNICAAKNKATAIFTAQSGAVSKSRPLLKAKCPGKARKGKGGRGR